MKPRAATEHQVKGRGQRDPAKNLEGLELKPGAHKPRQATWSTYKAVRVGAGRGGGGEALAEGRQAHTPSSARPSSPRPSSPRPHLPPLRLELRAQGASPAQLLFQLPRALGVARVALLQLPHLPPQLPQLTQAAATAVQRGLQLPCALRGLTVGRR